MQVQGNLVEMLAPSLAASSTNADIAALLKDLIDRLLVKLSGGAVSELDVELANALPRLSRDGTGLSGTDLDAFEAHASALADGSERWEVAAHRLVEALAAADASGGDSAKVPLYGEATKESLAALDVHVGGRTLTLEAAPRWTVRGPLRDEPTTRAHTPAAASVERPTSALSEPLRPPVAASSGEPAMPLAPAAVGRLDKPSAAGRADKPAAATAAGAPQGQGEKVIGPVAAVQGKPEPAARPAETAGKPQEVPPVAAGAPGKPATSAPEPAMAPLTPAPIVSIGAPAQPVDRPAIAASASVPFGPEAGPSPVRGPEKEPSPTVPAIADAPKPAATVESGPVAPAAATPAQPTPIAAIAPAVAPRAATPAPPAAQRPPSEVRPAASVAPANGARRTSAMKLLVFLLLVVLGIWLGRFVRSHYLHWR